LKKLQTFPPKKVTNKQVKEQLSFSTFVTDYQSFGF
jgi:hypothetical protein